MNTENEKNSLDNPIQTITRVGRTKRDRSDKQKAVFERARQKRLENIEKMKLVKGEEKEKLKRERKRNKLLKELDSGILDDYIEEKINLRIKSKKSPEPEKVEINTSSPIEEMESPVEIQPVKQKSRKQRKPVERVYESDTEEEEYKPMRQPIRQPVKNEFEIFFQ